MPKPTDDQIIQFVQEMINSGNASDTSHAIMLVVHKYDISPLDVATAYHNITSGAPAATGSVETSDEPHEPQDEAEQEALRLEQEENARRAAELAASQQQTGIEAQASNSDAKAGMVAAGPSVETVTVTDSAKPTNPPIDLSVIDPTVDHTPADTNKKKK